MLQGIKKNLERVFDFSQSTISCAQPSHSPLLVDNKSFYESISVVDFFSDFGRHFRLSSMLNKESVKSRLGVMVTNNNKDEVNDDKNSNLHTTTHHHLFLHLLKLYKIMLFQIIILVE
jgi:hypothetical protein